MRSTSLNKESSRNHTLKDLEVKISDTRSNAISASQEEKRKSQLDNIPARMPWGKAARPKGTKEGEKKETKSVKPKASTDN